jgi:single-stranded DNA-binding protein
MQLFYGTLTFNSTPISTQDSTLAKGTVAAISDKSVDTPVGIRAYGRAGNAMMNAKPGTRIQVIQGTIHRTKDYTYVVDIIKFNMLPDKLDSTMYPDWHEIVLAGRTVKELDKSDNRQFFVGNGFTVVKRGIAVNQGRDKVSFFDVSAYSSEDAKFKITESIAKFCSGKGTYLMVRGTLNSKRGTKPNEDGTRTVFTDVSVSQLFLGPKTEMSNTSSSNGNGYSTNNNGHNGNGNGAAYRPEAYQPAPLPGAQPQMATEDDLPF